ncbi:hypothetical protein Taro_019362, partial [Colocasia esculenta]|nr:hypothetical protein [Colocasia esculenta]
SGALVVLVEVLPGPACVASAVLLTAVSFLMVRVVWSFGLCILVKVLPRIALCRFWWKFFPGVLCVCFGPPLCCPCGLKCVVWLSYVLVRFSQDGSWRFWWRFSPKLFRALRRWDFVCPRALSCSLRFSRLACSHIWWSGECRRCLAGCASCGSTSLALWFASRAWKRLVAVRVSFLCFPLAA